ncbi:hypothetical protein BD310DRAFT_866481 [Dichomitus squalens]|uniref:Conidiation protein 6-domain-containing protein n=1 Tax=Dichomitus squalens TaxID=114155 RepID=A0A4Q9QBJ4_9APHY|nr:hypothetical protein BD310DRAFT_866481 [Dichomitus squalens]
MPNPGNVARGLEGAANNSNNSEEARADAQRRLDEMDESGQVDSAEAHAGQVERGHKASHTSGPRGSTSIMNIDAQANLSNARTSEDSKEQSKKVLGDLED